MPYQNVVGPEHFPGASSPNHGKNLAPLPESSWTAMAKAVQRQRVPSPTTSALTQGEWAARSGPRERLSHRPTTFGSQTEPLLRNHGERTNRLKGAPPNGRLAPMSLETAVSLRLCQEGWVPAPKLVASTKVNQAESCEDGETSGDSLPCRDHYEGFKLDMGGLYEPGRRRFPSQWVNMRCAAGRECVCVHLCSHSCATSGNLCASFCLLLICQLPLSLSLVDRKLIQFYYLRESLVLFNTSELPFQKFGPIQFLLLQPG